ncbi:MAG TPA: acetolactate synthase small subunit [Lentisphaeria bacterium]|nr:MAG: Acetolactate synthase small subunit [Lentisphaerae bacterium ADurb.Bin082]HQC51693.1 acetolactate synthase small subunit [Lentisphaeria bacterium]HQL88728.1 acetolactate synthase small subunit [Lentisphaeria bacterium]
MDNDEFVISMLVNNEAGVLTRVSGLFARRGFNIDSLSVGVTEQAGLSRITITAHGDDYIKDQIIKQLAKLQDVKVVKLMPFNNSVMRELLLIKVQADRDTRSSLLEAASVFRAKIVDLKSDSVTLEITGERSKCEAFVEYLRPYGIVELCRTGLTAISRGLKPLKDSKSFEEESSVKE